MNYAYIDPGTGYTIAGLLGILIAFGAGILGLFAAFYRRIFKFFKNNKKFTFIIVVLLIAAVLVLLLGKSMKSKTIPFGKKVIILGFDGLSPEIVEPMMERGKLPNFKRLKETGSYTRLSTTNPPQSPVAWTGFATGQNPGKHDVYDFIIRDPESFELTLSLSNIRHGRAVSVVKSRRFWEYTSDKGIPTIILGCPVTFPPDKICGRMISGMGVPDVLGTEGTFTFYTTEEENGEKDIGGTVVYVRKAPLIVTNLYGPKKSSIKGGSETVTVPMKIETREETGSVLIQFQNNSFELKQGKWSDWKSITFDLGFRRKMKGIVRFYLVESRPELKLYAGPINFDPRDPFFPISYPSDYSMELTTAIGLYYTQGMPMDTWAVNENRLSEQAHIEQVNEVLNERKAMLDYELNRFSEGVLYCYFESPDIVQHMFWRYIDPLHPLYRDDAPEEYTQMIYSWYKKLDAILGEVMSGIGENDYLIVLSDHGFNTFRRAVHVNTWLRENGYLELKDPYASSGGELLLDVDWSKTKAYSIGFGSIYVNQKGREKYGIVQEGSEAEELKAEIADGVGRWIDDRYDMQVASRVYDGRDIFRGKYSEDMPDLVIGFNIGYRASWQSALGAVPEVMIEDNMKKWSGSHLFDPALIPGILFCNKPISKENASIYDIAPTILEIAGFNADEIVKADFDGSPLF